MIRDKLLQATEIIKNKLEKNPALKDIGDTTLTRYRLAIQCRC